MRSGLAVPLNSSQEALTPKSICGRPCLQGGCPPRASGRSHTELTRDSNKWSQQLVFPLEPLVGLKASAEPLCASVTHLIFYLCAVSSGRFHKVRKKQEWLNYRCGHRVGGLAPSLPSSICRRSPSGILLGNYLSHLVGTPGGIVTQGILPSPAALDTRPRTGLGIGILCGGRQDWEHNDPSSCAEENTELVPASSSAEQPSVCPSLAWTFKCPHPKFFQ